MKQLIYMLFTLMITIASCDDTKVGYLETEDAGYDPDTMIIRKELDPILDAGRIERGYPWVTTQLQGILGTLPYSFRITGVRTPDGNADSFKKEAILRGDSAFEIPAKNDIPKGTYTIDVAISNKGYTHVKEGAFTFIVE